MNGRAYHPQCLNPLCGGTVVEHFMYYRMHSVLNDGKLE